MADMHHPRHYEAWCLVRDWEVKHGIDLTPHRRQEMIRGVLSGWDEPLEESNNG